MWNLLSREILRSRKQTMARFHCKVGTKPYDKSVRGKKILIAISASSYSVVEVKATQKRRWRFFLVFFVNLLHIRFLRVPVRAR